MTRPFRPLLLLALALAVAAPARAEPPDDPLAGAPAGSDFPGPGRPAFLDALFPARLVMRYQAEIALTDAQREAITAAMGAAQKTFVDLQWQLEAESAKLAKLLAAERVDERATLAQAETLMAVEQRLKTAHLGLLVRIKNELTPAQQEKLQELRPLRGRGWRRWR